VQLQSFPKQTELPVCFCLRSLRKGKARETRPGALPFQQANAGHRRGPACRYQLYLERARRPAKYVKAAVCAKRVHP